MSIVREINPNKRRVEMKRLKKGSETGRFGVRWIQKDMYGAFNLIRSATYNTIEERIEAMDCIRSQKTKRFLESFYLHPCPDSKETQSQKYMDSGATWKAELNEYVYSARY
jgi:hypothetical protein